MAALTWISNEFPCYLLLVKTSFVIATHGDVLQVQASLEHLGFDCSRGGRG